MEILETLAVALGFATLAGINLYLVVFISGLAINQGWIDVSQSYPELMALGDPLVVVAAGIFFCAEFFSDKIPWVDSLWDTVHTVIRPVGGGLLALHTLGPTDPAFEIVVALLAGGATLVSHGFKSGTRLVLNTSPEPFTNVAASVVGDVVVISGLALMKEHPLVAGVVFLSFISVAAWATPKLYRRIKAFATLVVRRLKAALTLPQHEPPLSNQLEESEVEFLRKKLGNEAATVLWSAPVIVGQSNRLLGWTNSTKGSIVRLAEHPEQLHFVGSRMWRPYHAKLSLKGLTAQQRSRWFSEEIELKAEKGKRRLLLRIRPDRRDVATRVVTALALPAPAVEAALEPAYA
ncbi:MAG: DUF4126 domain-containing protein [Verrucomicrobiota bacterium]